MKTLKFSHSYVDSKEVDAEAWKSVGVTDQKKVTWSAENNFTAEVSDSAAEYLLEHEKDSFEDVTGKDEEGDTSSSAPDTGSIDEAPPVEPSSGRTSRSRS